jgi:hypothetical protein
LAQPDFVAALGFHPAQRFKLPATITTIAGLLFWFSTLFDGKPGEHFVIVHVLEEVGLAALVAVGIFPDEKTKRAKVCPSFGVEDDFNGFITVKFCVEPFAFDCGLESHGILEAIIHDVILTFSYRPCDVGLKFRAGAFVQLQVAPVYRFLKPISLELYHAHAVRVPAVLRSLVL